MANMELTPAESKEEGKELAEYRPRYAVSEMWFDDNAMKTLKLDDPPKVGSMMAFYGVAKVVSVSMRDDNATDTDAPEVGMSIQPVEFELTPQVKKIDAKAMFPNSKMED